MADYRVLTDHGNPTPTIPRPAKQPLPSIVAVQEGLPVIYGAGTEPVCGIRVVHPTNPKACSVHHSVVMLYVPPHTKLDLHCHEAEETYSVISGTGIVMFDGGTQPVGPGTFIFLPSWCNHGIENTGTEMLVVLLSTAPANP